MPGLFGWGRRPARDWRAEERALAAKRAASWARIRAAADRRVGR